MSWKFALSVFVAVCYLGILISYLKVQPKQGKSRHRHQISFFSLIQHIVLVFRTLDERQSYSFFSNEKLVRYSFFVIRHSFFRN